MARVSQPSESKGDNFDRTNNVASYLYIHYELYIIQIRIQDKAKFHAKTFRIREL